MLVPAPVPEPALPAYLSGSRASHAGGRPPPPPRRRARLEERPALLCMHYNLHVLRYLLQANALLG